MAKIIKKKITIDEDIKKKIKLICDFAELQALEMRQMKMSDWIKELDNHIILNRKQILQGKGTISHKEAIKKAEKEYNIYRQRELEFLQSDFDLYIKDITNNNLEEDINN